MNNNYLKRNNISSSSHFYSDDDEDNEENEDEKSNFKLICFFIFVIFLGIISLLFVLIIVYYIIIKPEKLNRIRRSPSNYISYTKRIKIEKYLDDLMTGKLPQQKVYSKVENPKISIIIPVYNKQQYITRVLRSIQNQSFKDIEIIFCDDHSYDNSTILIEKYQKEDERIVLLKQEKNKGTLRNRVDGIKIAKGEYILFIDPDDLFLDGILEKLISIINSNNVDILQFQVYYADLPKLILLSEVQRSTEPIYQPKLSDLMYYEKGYLHQTEFVIWGKIVKKDIFLKVVNSLNDYYLNQNMCLHEDGLLLFILFKKANSYLLIKDYGMLYIPNENNTMSNLRKQHKINKTVRDCFLYSEFMIDYTNNTVHEKAMAFAQFKGLLNGFKDIYLKITNGYDYIFKVINKYLKCKIISEKEKIEIKQLKAELILAKKKNLKIL